ncbi:MAG: hypothetical protein INR71_09845, partial [Terriglobus roseus]|nr:hypothetical protein [Terriglobus roseus]
LDLAATADVSFQLQQTQQHVRVRSLGGTPVYHRSRANSIAFADTAHYVPPSPPRSSDISLVTASESDSEALNDQDEEIIQQMSRHASRRPSAVATEMQHMRRLLTADEQEAAAAGVLVSSLAAMSAWRDQIVAQVNSFQHSVAEMRSRAAALPQLPPLLQQLPAVVGDPLASSSRGVVRRFSSMMPPGFFTAREAPATSPPPPPYEEKDPAARKGGDDEKAGLFAAAAEATLDEACERQFGVVTTTAVDTSATTTRRRAVGEGEIVVDTDIEVRIGGKTGVTHEQQMQLRLARQARLERGSGDWKVWVIWVSLPATKLQYW